MISFQCLVLPALLSGRAGQNSGNYISVVIFGCLSCCAEDNWWMGQHLCFPAHSACPSATLWSLLWPVIIQTDHRHLPQPILLLKGMLSRNTGLKKVKFACSCSVLSVPLSISGIKCLLLGVRFCLCPALSCQYSPVPWSLSLPRLVPPLYPFPTPLAGVSSLFEVEWISTEEITDKKYTLAPSKLQRRNWLPDLSIQYHLGALSVQGQATFCHKYLSFIKILPKGKNQFWHTNVVLSGETLNIKVFHQKIVFQSECSLQAYLFFLCKYEIFSKLHGCWQGRGNLCPKLIFGEKHANKAVIIMRMGSSCPWAFWEPTEPWLLWWTKARENSLILGHLWNSLSIVFKARELSRKYFLSVFICNLMLSCSRVCLWNLVLVLCTFIWVKVHF